MSLPRLRSHKTFYDAHWQRAFVPLYAYYDAFWAPFRCKMLSSRFYCPNIQPIVNLLWKPCAEVVHNRCLPASSVRMRNDSRQKGLQQGGSWSFKYRGPEAPPVLFALYIACMLACLSPELKWACEISNYRDRLWRLCSAPLRMVVCDFQGTRRVRTLRKSPILLMSTFIAFLSVPVCTLLLKCTCHPHTRTGQKPIWLCRWRLEIRQRRYAPPAT